MKRIIAVVICLALLVPIRMSLKVSGNASKKVQEITASLNKAAGRQFKKASEALKVNSQAVAKTIKSDVSAMKDMLGNSLPKKSKRKPAILRARKYRSNSILTLRSGIDITIAAALALLLVVPTKHAR